MAAAAAGSAWVGSECVFVSVASFAPWQQQQQQQQQVKQRVNASRPPPSLSLFPRVPGQSAQSGPGSCCVCDVTKGRAWAGWNLPLLNVPKLPLPPL